jgi:hypothetical protein
MQVTKKVVKKHGLHPKKPALKKVKKVIKEAMKVEKKTAGLSRKLVKELEKGKFLTLEPGKVYTIDVLEPLKLPEAAAHVMSNFRPHKDDLPKIQGCPTPLPTKLTGEVVGVPEAPEIVTVKVKGRAKPYNDKKARMPAGTVLRQGYDGNNWHGSLTADGVEVHASNRAFAIMVRGLFEAYNERLARDGESG